MEPRPELEAVAARVDDDDPAGEANLDEATRRALARMRALRDALRAAGPAPAPPGLAERIVARALREGETARVVRLQARRERRVLLAQAASLAALLLAYGSLFAGHRVARVGDRIEEQRAELPADPAAAGARPDEAALEPAPFAGPAPAPFPHAVPRAAPPADPRLPAHLRSAALPAADHLRPIDRT